MSRQLVIFHVGARRFGLDLLAVERVTRAVFVTSLPHAPENVLGVINVQGRIVPVLDVRRLWSLEAARDPQEMSLNDEFIVVQSSPHADVAAQRPVALWVEAVEGVLEFAAHDWISLNDLSLEVEDAPTEESCVSRYFEGAVKRGGEIILVCNPRTLLDSELNFGSVRLLPVTESTTVPEVVV